MSLWVGYPRSYTPGRRRPVQFITLHYTAGSEGPTAAERGVAYDKVRLDGTSAHYYTDSLGPALQEVPDGDRAHTALFHGNEIGIHIEICGTRQTRAQWLDDTSLATLTTTAALVRELGRRHGIPMVSLSVAETRAAYYSAVKPKGINDHYACTYAFPEDGGDHTDVGPEFPWDVFMDMVTGAEDDMTPQDTARLFNAEQIAWGLRDGVDEVMIVSTWEDPDHGGHVGDPDNPADRYPLSLLPHYGHGGGGTLLDHVHDGGVTGGVQA